MPVTLLAVTLLQLRRCALQSSRLFLLLYQSSRSYALGDAVMISIPLLRRQGIDRAAKLSLSFALLGATAWVLSLTVLAPS